MAHDGAHQVTQPLVNPPNVGSQTLRLSCYYKSRNGVGNLIKRWCGQALPLLLYPVNLSSQVL